MYAYRWGKLDKQDRDHHERFPIPYIAEAERWIRPLNYREDVAMRAWRILSRGRQGGGLGVGSIAYSEAVFYLREEWGMERGPFRDLIIRLIYATDAAYVTEAQKRDGN